MQCNAVQAHKTVRQESCSLVVAGIVFQEQEESFDCEWSSRSNPTEIGPPPKVCKNRSEQNKSSQNQIINLPTPPMKSCLYI